MKYTITLSYQDKQYSFLDDFDYQGWDEYCDADYQVIWMYTEGNYGCDCNLSDFLYQHCDVDFKNIPDAEWSTMYPGGGAWTLPCGRTIHLVSIADSEHCVIYP